MPAINNKLEAKQNKSNEMKGKVETYIDKDGNLVAWGPDPALDWERLSEITEETALAELFAHQTANGYEWLKAVDLGGYMFKPILGWNVQRDEKGKYLTSKHIFRFCGFRIIDALRKLKPGQGIIFYKVK